VKTGRRDAIFAAMQLPFHCAFAAVALAAAAPLASLAQPAPAEQVSLGQAGDASVGGLWCGAGLLHEFTLELEQQLQSVQGRLIRKARVREITGHVEGKRVKVDPQRDHTMELQAEGDELRIVSASGVLALAAGQSFTRAAGGSCKG
jgi:hypothetical protein